MNSKISEKEKRKNNITTVAISDEIMMSAITETKKMVQFIVGKWENKTTVADK